MLLQSVKIGMRVRTNQSLGSTRDFLVEHRYLVTRTPDKPGVILNYAAGHDGDVWWVKHDDGSIGAYCYEEFEPEVES